MIREERDSPSRRRRAVSSAMIILYVCRASFFSTFFFPLLPLVVSLSHRSLSIRLSRPRISSLRSVYASVSLARTRETPRCISSIFKRHGLSARGSASIYKASGRLVSCLVPSWWSHRRKRGIRIVRGSVTKSIRCRRAAFYLHPPPSTSFSHSRSISLCISFVISPPFLICFLSSSLPLLLSFTGMPLFDQMLSFYRSMAFPLMLVSVTAGGCSLA